MSRIANKEIEIPVGVDFSIAERVVSVKGSVGSLQINLHDSITVDQNGATVKVGAIDDSTKAVALSGTFRSLINNSVIGVSKGFEKRLTLVGVGYRAQAKGSKVELTLGFSHPVSHNVPDGIIVETPSQTEIIVKGADKQVVGQVAADIRAYRPPEPYKGKGVKYNDEYIIRKEAKKK
jgi:large subunit ribosomal protein L6